MEAIRNGEFDASEMAANVPYALKSFAEKNGIDLETMLGNQAAPPPPFPPMMYGSDGFPKMTSSEDLNSMILDKLSMADYKSRIKASTIDES